MTDVYIQRIGTPGTGDVLFPDAAMDIGTLALLDTIDGWAWASGSPPVAGAALSAATTLKNYALLEDGHATDPAMLVDASTYGNGAIAVTGTKRLQLPAAFNPLPGMSDVGIIHWLSHVPDPAATGFNNSLFGAASSTGVLQYRLVPTYGTVGALTTMEFRVVGRAATLVASAGLRTAMASGAPLQFGVRVTRDYPGNLARIQFYLNGVLLQDSGWAATTADWTALGAGAMAFVGRDGALPGTGLNGRVWRSIVQNLTVANTATMDVLVARDYTQNADRIAAAAALP
jgi:hypothetical protein